MKIYNTIKSEDIKVKIRAIITKLHWFLGLKTIVVKQTYTLANSLIAVEE